MATLSDDLSNEFAHYQHVIITETNDWNTRAGITYIAELEHLGLNKHKVLKDKDYSLLRNKVRVQLSSWDVAWQGLDIRQRQKAEKEANQKLAGDITRKAQKRLEKLEKILKDCLLLDHVVVWEDHLNYAEFESPDPLLQLNDTVAKLPSPIAPISKEIPVEPDKQLFEPKLNFLEAIFPSLAKGKQKKADESYEKAKSDWQIEVERVRQENSSRFKEYESQLTKFADKKKSLAENYQNLHNKWVIDKQSFYDARFQFNQEITNLERAYRNRDENAILKNTEFALKRFQFFESFPTDFYIEYGKDSRMLVVDYNLPTPAEIPTLVEMKFFSSKNELKEQHLSEGQISKYYDTAIYNIALGTLYKIFKSDDIDGIETVVFNGWVEMINKATGKMVRSCIASLQANKSEFLNIDFEHVEPKTCFKGLKGVASSKLSGITAIVPIVQINRNDKRFVSSYDVSSGLHDGYNLASMNWEDFEHLIRELFEKEFSANNGEVKVTQASRDGGVDAVAFDPDPIRGGKIVIQAKRYTNTVGVAAVRDLYGTVMNEGASKGILVTTSDYGPDAYEFVKNKPLTLLSGSHLLHLLQKHGQKAKIDIQEAKKLAGR